MATLNDVAKLAGVSRGTVSNVINHVKVREESRIKVEKAIKELNYVPDIYARGLKTNKTNTVVFILPTIWNPFFCELTYHLQLELQKRNLKMLLCNSGDDYEVELEYIKMAMQNKVDGIISISYSDIEPYISSNLPLVSIERCFHKDIPYVTSENYAGGYLAADCLVKRGCKKLLFLGRSAQKNISLIERKDGFLAYCKERNIEYHAHYRTDLEGDYRLLVQDILHEEKANGYNYDGIFTVTDRYGEYCLETLQEMGISVPEQVQIIGFDGAKSHVNDEPKISSIRQPVEDIAACTVEILEAVMKHEECANATFLPVSFHAGKTTK